MGDQPIDYPSSRPRKIPCGHFVARGKHQDRADDFRLDVVKRARG